MNSQDVAHLIDSSPMNRGMVGERWLRRPGNIALSSDYGDVVLFDRAASGVYEFHWLRVSSGQGVRSVVNWTLDCIDQVFRDTGCQLMFGLVPDDRRDSRMMARLIGSKFLGKVPTEHGLCQMFIMTREMREGAK